MTDDITKHKDWQKWGLIAQNSSLGIVERHTVLELAFREVGPLIFAAGREAERELARELVDALQAVEASPWHITTLAGSKTLNEGIVRKVRAILAKAKLAGLDVQS